MRIFLVCLLGLAGLMVFASASDTAAAPGFEGAGVLATARGHHHHHHHRGNGRRGPAQRTKPALYQPMTGLTGAGFTPIDPASASDPVADSGDVVMALAVAVGLGLAGGLRLRAIGRA